MKNLNSWGNLLLRKTDSVYEILNIAIMNQVLDSTPFILKEISSFKSKDMSKINFPPNGSYQNA